MTKKNIINDLITLKEDIEKADSLLFDGEPISDETLQVILMALDSGMDLIRKKTNAKDTSNL